MHCAKQKHVRVNNLFTIPKAQEYKLRLHFSLLQTLAQGQGIDEKNKYHIVEVSQRIRLPKTRKPLDKPVLRDVQCRDQLVVDRLFDRSHPNKVSMKKRKKEKKSKGRREDAVFMLPGSR
jgi:hypothetical protein